MNSALISLLFSIGAATWIYTQLVRRGGVGNGKQSFMGAALAFVFVYIIFYVTLHFVLSI